MLIRTDRDKELLKPPISRAAYSDRTAWLLAEFSRLAYKKFETPEEVFNDASEKLVQLQDVEKIKTELYTLVKRFLVPGGRELQDLKDGLAEAGFELIQTFNIGGTQAFLAKRATEKMAVLSFRGTEADGRDIKTDLNARFSRVGGSKVHSGFWKAFQLVEPAIRQQVEAMKDYKLYITGHSLGGALALVTTRTFNADNIAACYTYGSPKVGTLEFGDDVKVPVYRVVHAADLVPRLPPTWAIPVVIALVKLIPIRSLRDLLVAFFEQHRGYRHHGDMRYLTGAEPSSGNLKLFSTDRKKQRCRDRQTAVPDSRHFDNPLTLEST